MKKRFPLMPISTMISGIVLVSAISAGVIAIESRYEKQDMAQAQYKGFQGQIDQQRIDLNERRLYELEREKEKKQWSPASERERKRLQDELDKLRGKK